MRFCSLNALPALTIVLLTMTVGLGCTTGKPAKTAKSTTTVPVRAAGFRLGKDVGVQNQTNRWEFALQDTGSVPFVQSCVKQTEAPAKFGPNPDKPYFTVRFAMPVPPENVTNNFAALAGMDPQVFTHNHSPGFEILPNGDALAIYFSTPPGKAEADASTSFVQARLRYGSEDWDMPELFFKTEGFNDQSGLLWNDGGAIRFFGGGRAAYDNAAPFRMATSTDNGATWTFSVPQVDQLATDFTAQPITSAYRQPDKSMCFAMDGDGATSFLWRSADDGIHWQQLKGRTSGRHSVIVPLDDQGNLLSIGGKNNSIDGWSPQNTSTDWGATWSAGKPSPFPPLGSAQRPSLIKLANGHLFFVSDAWLQKKDQAPPAGWQNGDGCFVAISTNNGESWHIKTLPVQLPNHQFRKHGTVGYVTARQAPNGVIHVLTTETQPCLHYELNEAWVWSDAGDIAPENEGGRIEKFSENYPSGKVRSRWSARICPDGRYLLTGNETDYYDTGAKQHEAIYVDGRKNGVETYWSADGKKRWTWTYDWVSHRAVWSQFWPNGRKKFESAWDTAPQARDLARTFFGFVADGFATQWNEDGQVMGTYRFSNGMFVSAVGVKRGGSL